MESLYTVDGDVNWYSHCGKQYGVSLKNKQKKSKNIITIWSINSTSSYVSRKKKPLIKKDKYPTVYAELFTIAKISRYANHLSTHQQMNG